MNKNLAKKYEKKIIENLEKLNFERVENVSPYKHISYSGEELYSVGDLYIEIVVNGQGGWHYLELDLEYDEYMFECDEFNDADNSHDKIERSFEDINDLRAAISDRGYSIIPEEDTLN